MAPHYGGSVVFMLHICVLIFDSRGSVFTDFHFYLFPSYFSAAFRQYEEFPALYKCSIFQRLLLSFAYLLTKAAIYHRVTFGFFHRCR